MKRINEERELREALEMRVHYGQKQTDVLEPVEGERNEETAKAAAPFIDL